jgi:hypothetical protein
MNGPRNNRNTNQRGGKQGNKNNNNRQREQSKQTETMTSGEQQEDESNSGFHCDACDVTFHEEAKLKVHIAAHRSCPDCAYKASPSLVREHQKLTHGSGKDEGEVEVSTSSTSTSTSISNSASTPGSKPARPPNAGTKATIANNNMIHPLAPKLNTPEDIAAWIAQRRKQWPTETNIQKKVNAIMQHGEC